MKSKRKAKQYKPVNPNLFFKVSLQAIRDKHLLRNLSDSQLKVLLVIASFMNKNRYCYPSQKQIAWFSNKTVETVSRIVRSLEKMTFEGEQVLHIDRDKREGGKFYNNRYTLSSKLGIYIFNDKKPESQKSITDLNQTNKNNLYKEKHLLKKKQSESLSSIKEIISANNYLDRNSKGFTYPDQLTEQDKKNFDYLVDWLVANSRHISGNKEYAVNSVKGHIKKLTLEVWRDLCILTNRNPRGAELYSNITYQVLAQGLEYKQALNKWDREQ